jgi:hypothetical protein
MSIVAGNRMDGQGSIPGMAKIFLFSATSRLALGPTHLPIQWVPRAISLGVKWLEHEADHSPPSCTEVKNGGAVHPLSHKSLWHCA